MVSPFMREKIVDKFGGEDYLFGAITILMCMKLYFNNELMKHMACAMRSMASMGLAMVVGIGGQVWADGYFVPSDYVRPDMNQDDMNIYGSPVMTAANKFNHEPTPENRENLLAALKEYPEQVNDFHYDHGEYSPLLIAIQQNDYELVKYMLNLGAEPMCTEPLVLVEMLRDAKLDQRIVETMTFALRYAGVHEACVKARLLPSRQPWSYSSLWECKKPMVSAVGDDMRYRTFSRVPAAAEWLTVGYGSTPARVPLNLLVQEGLQSSEDGTTVFVRMGLGLSQDGKLMCVELHTLREGETKVQRRIARYHISLTPYLFTIPRKDGKTSIIAFCKAAKQVRHTILGEDGQPESTELLYPRAHQGTEYKRENGRTTTEGFELPAVEPLLAL